ncbi:MAG: hypothetical protein AAGA96_06020 [Verrucomicrobiota bacterium]
MEYKSSNNASPRRRGNRSGGNRNRNRNRSSNHRGGGSGNRNPGSRNRSRNRSRRRRAPKPTGWQKFLQLISFGKLGQPKRKARKKSNRNTATRKPPLSQPATSTRRKERPKTEVTSGRLYVGNLTYATTEEELEELFRGFGNVMSAEVVTNSKTQQSKGFAFVEMSSIDEAKRAVEILDDQDFNGRRLTVSGARSSGPRDQAEDADATGPETDPDYKPASESPSESDIAEARL